MPLHVSSTCAHHQVVKIALHRLWYHHTYRWLSRAQVERVLTQPVRRKATSQPVRETATSQPVRGTATSQPVHRTATHRYDDTRGCVM
jgi:hypothetical protein